MSAAIRLFLSCSLALASTGVVFAADHREMPRVTLPLGPRDAGLIGTWTGTIAVDGEAELLDGGYIAIERAPGDQFRVTVGPEAEVRYEGARLERTENGLRFEVTLPGFETRLLAYDVAIDQGSMSGTVTFVRHRLTKGAQLAFVRH